MVCEEIITVYCEAHDGTQKHMLGTTQTFLDVTECEKWLLASSCMSIHPSFCKEQLSSHQMDSHKIWYLNIFPRSREKIQVLLNSDKNKGYFTWRPVYIFFVISCWILLRM